MTLRSGLAVVGLLLGLLPAAHPTGGAQAKSESALSPTASAPERAAREQTLTLANANVREGGRSRPRADLRVAHDRKAFVRRLMRRADRVPGVVTLQETYGSARAYVHALNRHPRAKRAGAKYRLAARPSLRSNQRRCGSTKRARHQRVQTSAIIVSRAKVRRVIRRGAVAGWGRWRLRKDRTKTVDNCAYQPWVLLRMRSGGLVRIAGVHLAPANVTLKTRALRRLANRLQTLQKNTPRAQLVIAGDLNMTRQPPSLGKHERADGKIRRAHRLLKRRGLRDANRLARPRGRDGVIGYLGRIDFIYTTAGITDASFDRCYRGYLAASACAPSARVYKAHSRFAACQRQADSGKRRAACTKSKYRRYYSDHPMLTAHLRW